MLGLRFCARAFSSCGKWGPLFIAVRGPLTIAASLVEEHRLQAQAQQLWLTGPAAPRHVGSSQTRARTYVPCIGRQILNHCATREALSLILASKVLYDCLEFVTGPSVQFNFSFCPILLPSPFHRCKSQGNSNEHHAC